MNNVTTSRRRRGVFGGFTALAAVLAMASVAWACTPNPFAPLENEFLNATWQQVHCEVIHENDPSCGNDPNEAPVTFVAHGGGTLYNGMVVNVYQDNDDTDPTPGRFMSGFGGCDAGDDPRGTLTYGRQTIGSARIGTGSGVLVATDGPGLYGICAGTTAEISALGQFIFM